MSEAQIGNNARAGEPSGPMPEVGTPENPSMRILTLANAITVARLVLTLVFLYIFPLDINRPIAVAIYIVAAITDWLDGNIARATKTVSWFGKLLDPIVDRALIFTGVLALVIHGDVPLWVLIVLALRDLWLAIGVEYLKCFTDRPMDVMFTGKVATAFLMTGFSLLLIGTPDLKPLGLVSVPYLPLLNDVPAGIGMILVYIGLVLSVTVACLYWHKGLGIKAEVLAKRAQDQKGERD